LSLLIQVTSYPEEALYRLLASLQSKEFLYEQPAFPEVEYTFKHALTQEVAYGSVLHERRKALHERTAQAIEALFHSRLEDHYSELAHHYSRSGNTEKAIEHLYLAGQQAAQRFANAEAINHLTNALELLKTLPDTPERTQQELTLQIALGVPLAAVRGHSAPQVGAVYTRARELCQQVGKTPQLFVALGGLWQFYVLRAQLQPAYELGEQLLSLAQSVQDPALLPEAHRALGETLFDLGELAAAQKYLEQGVALYDPQQHRSHAFLYGLDPGVACLSFAALALWSLGYPEQALKKNHEALTLARELAHLYSLAFALNFTAWLHQLCREGPTAQEQAEAAMTLSTEQGFALLLAMGTILRGWALAEQGQGEEGITQMRQGLASWWATGAEMRRSCDPALLAEAYGKVGQAEEGLTVLAEALSAVEKTGERFYEAELYRLKGQLTLQQSGVRSPESGVQKEAEGCFRRAIEIARHQSAKSLELRAVMSLSRLWQSQGKKEEARQMLAEIYGWFTEGFDTADLQEAKALLEELA
jgi:predicted ATPase